MSSNNNINNKIIMFKNRLTEREMTHIYKREREREIMIKWSKILMVVIVDGSHKYTKSH